MNLSAMLKQIESPKKPASGRKKPARQTTRQQPRQQQSKQQGGVRFGNGQFTFKPQTGLVWHYHGDQAVPPEATRTKLKAAGMRWFAKKKLWWLPGTFKAQTLKGIESDKVSAFKKHLGFDPRTLG